MLPWTMQQAPDDAGQKMTTQHRAWFAGVLAAALLVVLLVTCSCGLAPRPRGLPHLYKPSVATMRMSVDGSPVSQCTAWKIGSDLIATAGHCCEPNYTYGIEGQLAGVELPKMLVDDDVHDVCILRGTMVGEAIKITSSDPKIGAPVWTAGYPNGWFLISSGFWSGRDADNDGVCSVVVAGGASGSPILDADGMAVGVLIKRVSGMDNLTLVAPIEALATALAIARSNPTTPVKIVRDEAPAPSGELDDLQRLLDEILKTLPKS